MEPKPEWLKKKIDLSSVRDMRLLMRSLSLHTVCESAQCPNRGECFECGTATFMILGDVCTRSCRFCAVSKGKPSLPDRREPLNIAQAAEKLGLRHIVITSVTRDDLEGGGASHFAACIQAVKERLPDATIEVLIPDFQGCEQALAVVIDAKPDIINHNIETVPSLYPLVRPQADYRRSLKLIDSAAKSGMHTKSGLMVGLGEREDQLAIVFGDLAEAGCELLTIGQYLSPSKNHLPVFEYVHPEQFDRYKNIALSLGIKYVASGPFVRSSYHAAEGMKEIEKI